MTTSYYEINPVDAYIIGSKDIQFFANIALPSVMKYKLPDYYISIFWILVEAQTAEERATVLRFALGLPRGFAKTTFIKILICWLIVYDLATFVLIICATEPLAENVLADISEILSSPNMESIYGKWESNLSVDNKSVKIANYRNRSVIIGALGAGSSLRGLNIRNARPDFILCDDMQTKENNDSPTDSARLLSWFAGTLLKAVNPAFSFVVYIGNMYDENCILYKLKNNKHWISLITGCILADKQSLWPELHSLEALKASFEHDESLGLAHIWFAEMMNDPASAKISLLPEGIIPTCPAVELEELQPEAGFVVIDPAGFKDTSDENVLTAHWICDDIGYIVGGEGGQLDPLAVIKAAIQMCWEFNIGVIAVESIAYQSTLKFWFDYIIEKQSITGITVVEVSGGNARKATRIRSFVKELLAKTYFIQNSTVRQKFTWQALAYKLDKAKNKDDWLDSCALGIEVRSRYPDLIVSPILLQKVTYLAKVVANNTPF